MITYCTTCELEDVPEGRIKLGFTTCLVCGEKDAKVEIVRRKGRVAILYDKGGYQYITDDTDITELG